MVALPRKRPVATENHGQEMRIDRLSLTNFRNLVDFEVYFDETSTRQVVVGRNGVGKSNLLEALTRIFRDLDLEEESEFGYEIEYLCNAYFVKVQSRQTNKDECDRNPNIPKEFSRRYWIAAEADCVEQALVGLGLTRKFRRQILREETVQQINSRIRTVSSPCTCLVTTRG
jgi:ATPase subunit of ABC transporter with duplicated ATPase domains